MPRAAILANALGYQAVWWACVAGASLGQPGPGMVASAAFVLATLAFGGRLREDLRMLLIAAPLGIGMDSAFAAAGWLVYGEPGPFPQFAPSWIAAMWMSFAMTLNHSLRFLRGKVLPAAAFGLLGGPLAYWAAARAFGVLAFADPAMLVLLAVGLAWAVLMPAVMSLAARKPREERFA